MYRTTTGQIIILNKITSMSRIAYDDNGEYRKVYCGSDAVTIRGDDCLSIERALDDSFGGTIWKWQ